jgi:hypothetical protein
VTLPDRDPHGYIAGARRVLEALRLAPRLRYAYQARSIRAGILVARGIESKPGGWIDWDLFERAYLRARVGRGHSRLVGIREARLSALLAWMDDKLALAGLPLVDRGYPLQRFGMCSIEYRSTAGAMEVLYFVTRDDVALVDLYLDPLPVPNRPPFS